MTQLLRVTRPNFLTLTVVCIALAATVALEHVGSIALLDLLLVSVLALAAHASVNAFNEYHDFRSGLDLTTQRTPFSGGSGALVESPHLARAALSLACVTLAITIVAGLWLVWVHSWQLLWLGVIGVVVIYTYTHYLNRSPLLCLLAPGVGFGMCMTLGASWVLSGGLSASAWVAALVVTLVVSNLLLLNQFPDIEADRAVGRRHLPIVWGEKRCAKLFAAFYGLAYGLIAVAVWGGLITPWALLALVSLGLCVPLMCKVLGAPQQVAQQVATLGLNVALVHVLPLLMAIGLVISWWRGA